jgi:hypothetical protein
VINQRNKAEIKRKKKQKLRRKKAERERERIGVTTQETKLFFHSSSTTYYNRTLCLNRLID